MSSLLFSRFCAAKSMPSMFTASARQMLMRTGSRQTSGQFSSSTLLAAGTSVSAIAYLQLSKPKVLCDFAVRSTDRDLYTAARSDAKAVANEVRKSRLDYRELSIGSFMGLFVGYLVGKLSKLLVFVSSSTYLFLQFLESRGLITMPYSSLYSWAKKRYGDKELILENISFKVAFALASAVAAANA
ncbi:hypothetical protein BZA70DRAFT_276972 [Myxozyma melibiosi]|uniref:Uncharacterized protein n=1 Tax=Myxozyma melibiosi TaxID=54550 RepID=A0ABR1F7E0_9ASCO